MKLMKKGVSIFIACSVGAAALNYATYPLLARLLPAQQFVSITVALSLFTQISTFLSSIVALTIGITKSGGASDMASRTMDYLQNRLIKLFFFLTLGFLALTPVVLPKISLSLAFAVPIVLMLIISLPSATVSGYLAGQRKMTKLGIFTIAGSVLQILLVGAVAVMTDNGVMALVAMALGQLLAIGLIYAWSKPGDKPYLYSLAKKQDMHIVPGLLRYAIISSLAIMAINLVQVADLLIVQGISSINVKFYTDIYIVSRVVFFGGMIFVWPFLSEINVKDHLKNHKPFARVVLFFTAITSAAVAGLAVLGVHLTQILFNTTYDSNTIRTIGILSVVYKFLLLIITASVLYFVVLRSYIAVWLSLATSSLILGYALFARQHTLNGILESLDFVALLMAVVSIKLVVSYKIKDFNS